jgi:hypothetical protein
MEQGETEKGRGRIERLENRDARQDLKTIVYYQTFRPVDQPRYLIITRYLLHVQDVFRVFPLIPPIQRILITELRKFCKNKIAE